MLSEVSQSQRTITDSHQLQRQKALVEGRVPGAGGGRWELLFNRCRVSGLHEKEMHEEMGGDHACTTI